MNFKKSITFLLLSAASLGISASAMADGSIDVHHAVTASTENSISLSLKISNPTTHDLIGAELTPSGSEFTSENLNNTILIGDLFTNSQITVDWTANTNMSETYFQSGLPLFFHLTATNSAGKSVDLPVYSLGEVQ